MPVRPRVPNSSAVGAKTGGLFDGILPCISRCSLEQSMGQLILSQSQTFSKGLLMHVKVDL
jgi:hypothetical protein